MITFTTLLRDLFCLSNVHAASGGAGDGRAFERRVERHFAAVGVRAVEVFSGVRSLGSQSLSGLYHQIDATGVTRDALIVGEWKAYRGAIPKNDLLRFKAATDDYWLHQYKYAQSPIMRIFGGTGTVSASMRRYAAQWGICLFTSDMWPSPILASSTTSWSGRYPDQLARRHLGWLARPHGAVMIPQGDGSWSIPRVPSDAIIDDFLALQDRWSAERWRPFRSDPRRLNEWLEKTIPWGMSA